MGSEKPRQNEIRETVVLRSKATPSSSTGVLQRAERRLVGAIDRGESRRRLVVNAERVRHAQLGRLRATDLIAELPTDDDDEPTRRHRENLVEKKAAWERMSVDDIIAMYAQRAGK